jgi:sec-independent protein translocase protein TatA
MYRNVHVASNLTTKLTTRKINLAVQCCQIDLPGRKSGLYTQKGCPMFGPTELMIILVIVILLFGVGRIGKIAAELGSGLRAFKSSLTSEEGEDKN